MTQYYGYKFSVHQYLVKSAWAKFDILNFLDKKVSIVYLNFLILNFETGIIEEL